MSLAGLILPTLDATCSDLTLAGLPTALERSKVNTPGGWLTAQSLQEVTLSGGLIRCHLFLIAPGGTGDRDALRICAGLLEKALTVVSLGDVAENQDLSYSVTLPHSQSPYPAWRLIIDIDL